MTDPLVHLERRSDGVALVTLDRPPVNALSVPLLNQLETTVDDLSADPPGAVVVWGGPRLFAAGADLTGFAAAGGAEVYAQQFRSTFDKLAALPRAVIAAVNGYALGGGCELALACDLRVVAVEALMGQPEVLLGLIPGAGGTQRLARLIGVGHAKDLVFTGRQIDAHEALRIGLADRVVPTAEVLDTSLALAGSLAKGPLLAIKAAKQAIDSGAEVALSSGLDLERRLFLEVLESNDAGVGIRAFLESGPGKAVFTGQ